MAYIYACLVGCAAADDEMRWLAARLEFGPSFKMSLTSKRCRVPAEGYHIPEHAATRVCEQ
jgi:putative SOS response-associated peptidase YedK